ncbi:hypothetical protein [Nocardia carnea]|uniref:hypothetical protein n=1 Tax=Nocardia carnea TaxID=37328 RepID=UPI0024559E5C|nr:hypothetical protein [Nocardia carnea]
MNNVEVDVDGIRKVAADAADIRDRLVSLRSRTLDALAIGPEAWGPDNFGERFAGGPHGFRNRMKQVTENMNIVAEILGQIADGQTLAAKALEVGEQAAAKAFDV